MAKFNKSRSKESKVSDIHLTVSAGESQNYGIDAVWERLQRMVRGESAREYRPSIKYKHKTSLVPKRSKLLKDVETLGDARAKQDHEELKLEEFKSVMPSEQDVLMKGRCDSAHALKASEEAKERSPV